MRKPVPLAVRWHVAAHAARKTGDAMSSTELTPENVELSEGMLGLIGAYGMNAAIDVRDLHPKGASESPPPERALASADTSASEGVLPRATG